MRHVRVDATDGATRTAVAPPRDDQATAASEADQAGDAQAGADGERPRPIFVDQRVRPDSTAAPRIIRLARRIGAGLPSIVRVQPG